jgi:ABC-2 type transport system permease protein
MNTHVTQYQALVRREFWEHRGAFFTTPAVISTVIISFTILGLIWFYHVAGGTRIVTDEFSFTGVGDLVRMLEQTNPEERAVAINGMLYGSTVIFNIALLFYVFFYFLGALYDDRKDKSVLFWKSLPVSDTKTVLSKGFSGAITAPALAWVAIVVTQLALLVIMTVIAWTSGASASSLIWGPAEPLQIAYTVLVAYIVQSLWWAPFHAWLLLASAFARRAAFLWAILPPALVGFAEAYLNYSWNFFRMIAERVGGGVIPLQLDFNENAHIGIMSLDPDRATLEIDMGAVMDLLTSADMLWGWLVAAVFISAAIWLRRYRDET